MHDSNFIQFGYWDSLKKGLLAGERLGHDLKRLDGRPVPRPARAELELTQHVSDRAARPGRRLIQLRETGECVVNLPEALFDLDCPGHYLRRSNGLASRCPA